MKTTPPLTGSVSILVPPKNKVLPDKYKSLQKIVSEPKLNVLVVCGIMLPEIMISPVTLPPAKGSFVLAESKAASA